MKLMEAVQPLSASDPPRDQATKQPAENGSIATTSPQPPLLVTTGSTVSDSDHEQSTQSHITDPGKLAILTLENKDAVGQLLTSSDSPNSCSVETSTTDSGVSNPSSLVSDFTGQLSSDVLHLPSNRAHFTDLEINADGGECSRASLPGEEDGDVSTLELGSKEGVSEKRSVLRAGESGTHTEDANAGLEGGTSRKGIVEGSENSSRCSSSLGCLEPRPCPTHEQDVSPRDVQKKLLDKMQSLSIGSDSVSESGLQYDSESVTSMEESGRTTERRTSKPRFSFFKRKRLSYVGSADPASQNIVASHSTTGLILENRPSNLPAKSAAEEKRHQKLYQELVATARKRELARAREEVRKEREKRLKDDKMTDILKEWSRVLPNWESQHKSRKVQELWWQGLPPGVRGEVWRRAIGNELNISPELYQISLSRCRERLALAETRKRSDSTASTKSLSREQSVEVIHLDVSRTFPTLGFFQEGGPFHETLHDVLGAYACYRPDVGYVQGMSFLAAVLLLNMEAADAFICLANLLNRPSYLAFFKVDHTLMQPYFRTFSVVLQDCLPRLSAHFAQLEFSPEYYLIEWIFTIYTRTLPLDIACRVWDMFCRDGDSFLFRTALGILRMYQSTIMEYQAIEDVGQFLGKLPPDIHSEALFQHIAASNLSSKKFSQILQQQQQQSPSR